MTFREYLRIVRVNHKFTVSKLSDEIGVPVMKLIELENGEAEPTCQKTIDLIVAGLNLTPNESMTFRTLAIESKNQVDPTANRIRSKAPLRVARDFDATDEEWADLIIQYNNTI